MLSEMWSDLRYRLRALVQRGEMERELAAEMRFHIEREAEKYERQGLPRHEALRRARLVFGGVERMKDETRDRRGTALLESVVQDVRYAVRGIRAKPGFAAGIVLTLALGIGANAAMFAIVDRLLLRPPPYLLDASHVHRIYRARTEDRQEFIQGNWSIGRYLDLRGSMRTLSSLSAVVTFRIAVGDGDAEREYPVSGVSASFFHLFSAHPVIGRFFAADEDRMPMGTAVAVLGNAYWQSRFGGRADVLGRKLHIGRGWFTIIGVAPQNFIGLNEDEVPAIFIPFTAFAWNARPEDHTKDYHWKSFELVARRAPGTSIAQAAADLTTALQRSRLSEQPGDPSWPRVVAAERLRAILAPIQIDRGPNAGPEARISVWVTGVTLIVLLIACANVTNLQLARALARRREIALRLALGVSRRRLVRQLLTESFVLAALGGVAALVVAQWGGAILRSLFLPDGAAATAILADWRTLAVTLLATLLAAVGTALAPAAHALRYNVAHALNAGGRDSGARRSRLRTSLLVLQATLCVMLLVGAGLFVRSLVNVRHLHLGYAVDPVLVVTENRRGVAMTIPEERALEQRLADEADAMPGVVAATPAPSIPFWAFEGRYLYVPGIDSVSLLGNFLLQAGNQDYFRVMGTRILRGRAFTASDRAGAPPVTVVSAGMAHALWPRQNPVGKCIRIDADTMPCTTVVGVAEDLHLQSLTSMREYTYYVPIAQYTDATGMLLVRVAGDAAAYAEPVRRQLQRIMPGSSYLTTAPLRAMVAPSMDSWRLGATMFVVFGMLALVLAAVGLYSVIAHGVAQRRQEIGVRIALGAPGATIVGIVVWGGVRLVLVGLALGSLIAVAAGRWVAGLLFDESPRDPAVYLGVAAILFVVAIIATAGPAVKAARVDPNVTLRGD